MILIPKRTFVETRINQAAHLIQPVTNLRTVNTKEVLLSADARIKTVTMELINIDKGSTFAGGMSYMCSPKPLPTATVDKIAGARTQS